MNTIYVTFSTNSIVKVLSLKRCTLCIILQNHHLVINNGRPNFSQSGRK